MTQVPGNERYSYIIISCTQQTTVTSDGDASDRNVLFGDQLVGALVLAQIPYPDVTTPITRNQFSLIRMNDHIIDRTVVIMDSLYRCILCLPDLDQAIFRTGHEPLTFAVESDACNIASMTTEDHNRLGIR